jgi:Ulp1 family protease
MVRALSQMSPTVLEVDRVIVAVHLGNHWTCALIDLAKQELCYYDSLGVCHQASSSTLADAQADIMPHRHL